MPDSDDEIEIETRPETGSSPRGSQDGFFDDEEDEDEDDDDDDDYESSDGDEESGESDESEDEYETDESPPPIPKLTVKEKLARFKQEQQCQAITPLVQQLSKVAARLFVVAAPPVGSRPPPMLLMKAEPTATSAETSDHS